MEKKKKPFKKAKVSFPHFRYYKPSKHPTLVIDEFLGKNGEEYHYRKVMHSEKDGKRRNEKIVPNPNSRDSKPMYIGKRVRHDAKNRFEETVLPWKYPKKK